MGRKKVSPAEQLEKAIARGYDPEAHREEDSKRDRISYEDKTLID